MKVYYSHSQVCDFSQNFFFISGTDSEALEILFSDLDTNSIIDAKEF